MRVFFAATSFVLLLFTTSCHKVVIDFSEEEYREEKLWFDYLCSKELGGRYSGSKGIEAAADYLCDIIGEIDERDSLYIDTFPTSRCQMKNIIFHIEGKKDSTIVIGAHYDAYGYYTKTSLPGADDNLSGVVVLLKVIKALQKDRINPEYGIDLCLFDGEEIGRHGSTRYVTESKKCIKHYINVDTVGNPDVELAFFYSKGCPYLTEGFEGLIQTLNMSAEEYNPEKFITDCETFKYQNIPFICMVCKNIPPYLHKSADNISNISFERLDVIAKGIESYLRTL